MKMNAIQKVFLYSVCILSTGICIFTVGKLALFLSQPASFPVSQTWFYGLLSNQELCKETFSGLAVDFGLLAMFILSHSLLRVNRIRNMWENSGILKGLERSVYNLISCTCLLFIIIHWRSLPAMALWELKLVEKESFWWFFVILHGFAWIVICSASILVDLPELFGFKQVYNQINGHPTPASQKSAELRRLLGHIRHPSFVFISIVLWGTNIMTLDRALLALIWSIYMVVAWNPDSKDVAYQKGQLSRKKYELSSFGTIN